MNMNRRFNMDMQFGNREMKKKDKITLTDTDFNTYYPMDKTEKIPPFKGGQEKKEKKERKEQDAFEADLQSSGPVSGAGSVCRE